MYISSEGKIIIVEDSPLLRVFLTNYLSSEFNFKIEEINSAKGLQYYLNHEGLENILLLVIDIFLPDGNGLEVIREFQEKNTTRKIPFIVLSGRLTKETVSLATKYGAEDILTKPVNISRLSQRITQILSDKYKLKKPRSATDYYQPVLMEIKRARRGVYNLSLLLTGILFKESLRPLHEEVPGISANLEQNLLSKIQNFMRETDTLLNLSASELLILLPFTDESGLEVVRGKINDAINEYLKDREKDLVLISASASHPQDGEDPEKLIYTLEENYKNNISLQTKNAES